MNDITPDNPARVLRVVADQIDRGEPVAFALAADLGSGGTCITFSDTDKVHLVGMTETLKLTIHDAHVLSRMEK